MVLQLGFSENKNLTLHLSLSTGVKQWNHFVVFKMHAFKKILDCGLKRALLRRKNHQNCDQVLVTKVEFSFQVSQQNKISLNYSVFQIELTLIKTKF